MLDEQAAREAREAALAQTHAAALVWTTTCRRPPQVDPLVAERQRREYESLFASNVVLSRRLRISGQMPAGASTARRRGDPSRLRGSRRSTRSPTPSCAPPRATAEASAQAADAPVEPAAGGSPAPRAAGVHGPSATGPISARRTAASRPRRHGDRRGADESPRRQHGRAGQLPRDQPGLLAQRPARADPGRRARARRDAPGPGARRDAAGGRVPSAPDARRQHRRRSTSSRAEPDRRRGPARPGEPPLLVHVRRGGAVGLVSGLAQLLGSAAFGLGDGDRTVIIAGSAADATAQASAQVMNRFLNRLPTITIREGHRVKVYLTSDLDLPEWSPSDRPTASQRR